MVYKWYILPIGDLYITYHLLREPGNSIGLWVQHISAPKHASRFTCTREASRRTGSASLFSACNLVGLSLVTFAWGIYDYDFESCILWYQIVTVYHILYSIVSNIILYCDIMLYYIIWHYNTLYSVILYCIKSYCITLYHTVLYT